MNRHKLSLSTVYSNNQNCVVQDRNGQFKVSPAFYRKGKFTLEESRKLSEIVHKMARDKEGKIDPKKINWIEVGAHVGRRPTNCNRQWSYINSYKGEISHPMSKIILDNIALHGIKDIQDVDWKDMVSKCGKSLDPNQLKCKFRAFLWRHTKRLPNWTFSASVVWLRRNFALEVQ